MAIHQENQPMIRVFGNTLINFNEVVTVNSTDEGGVSIKFRNDNIRDMYFFPNSVETTEIKAWMQKFKPE